MSNEEILREALKELLDLSINIEDWLDTEHVYNIAHKALVEAKPKDPDDESIEVSDEF